ncbi:histidine phosphatase family protein [Gordonia sp. zg691]|uniref:histidine phosphatase family protein n=1 Tax=Gordonia jinghuaiqii TaxID=2758710 RepID=UPI00166249EF|nr:histidine phosphatase family protein [Gordonia jinghuaiqii]MBD0859799.1 histidine phosphatase family protein [Gordonia jinghuaiqii]
MHLTLMRHGLPVRGDANVMDPGLDSMGSAQVRAVLPFLAAYGVDVLYSSPQLRARQSAVAVAVELAMPMIIDDGLVEFDHGAPYVHYDDASAAIWRSYFAGDLSPWGLTAAEFHARIARTIDAIADRHPGERVLAVCHGGVINAWACQVLGVPDRIRVMEPGYASVHRFERVGDEWSVVGLNEVVPVGDLDTAFTLGLD